MLIISFDPDEVAECRRLAETWAPVLHALANPDRLLIALWLAGTACTVRELQDVTGLSQPLVSYHLGELRKAGLVGPTAAGRANRYRLANPDLDKLAVLIGGLQSQQSPARAPDRGA